MRAVLFVLACLACEGHADKVQKPAKQEGLEALSALIASIDSNAGYQTAGSGLGSSKPTGNHARSSEPAQMMARRAKKATARKAFDPQGYPGVQAPTGFWDPLNFVEGGDDFTSGSREKFLRRRAVELKHGRVSMLACLGYIVPYFGKFPGSVTLDGSLKFADVPIGLKALTTLPPLGIAQILLLIGALELGPFKNDPENPGDFGWDPLGLKPDDPEEFRKKQNAELANGRLAMTAILGFLVGDVLNDGNPYVGGPFTAP